MDFLNHNHIKVTKRLTTDGINLKVDEEGMVQTKVTHLPLSAKAHLLKRNQDLPKNLKMIIEDVKVTGNHAAANDFHALDTVLNQAKEIGEKNSQLSEKDAKIAELEALLAAAKMPVEAPKQAPASTVKGGNKIPPAPSAAAFVNTNQAADDIN